MCPGRAVVVHVRQSDGTVFGEEPTADVVCRRQNLVSVHVDVRFGALSVQQLELEAVEEVDDEPLDLEDGKLLAGTQTTEANNRVLDCFAVFVESRVHEAIVFEGLKKN